MDVGVFSYRRTVLWAWGLLPILVLAGIHVVGTTVSRELNRAAAARREALRRLPDLDAREGRIDSLEAAFGLREAPAADGRDGIGARLNEAAQASAFRINSIMLERTAAIIPGFRETLRISIEGEGSLLELVRFMDGVQQPQHLTVVGSAVVRLVRTDPQPVYNVKLVLNSFVL